MNEIKVYHSVWKSALTIMAYLLMVALNVWVFVSGKERILTGCAAAFFFISAMMTLWTLLKEKKTKEPYLTITEESVKVAGRKGQEFRYADVESFVLKHVLFNGLFEVNYRNERANPGAIIVSDVAIKLKDLHAILNERLAAYK